MNGVYKKKHQTQNGFLDADAFLNTIPAFQQLSNTELKEFTRIVHVRWYSKDEPVFYAKEPGLGMYFIHKGSVKIYHDETVNGQAPSSILMRGEFFGELSFMENHRRPFSAVANEETCLIGMFKTELQRIVERKPKLGVKIMMILTQLISEQLYYKDEELRQIRENLSNANFIL